MIAQELEVSLHLAFVEARQKRHEFITVEHLLLALLDNPSAAEAIRACGGHIEQLRLELLEFIARHSPTLAGDGDIDTQPTLGFQRVIQRAILHVQSSGKKEVNGASVLVAIYGEKDSHAVYFLQKQGISRLDVVNYISHGISQVQQTPPRSDPEAKPRKRKTRRARFRWKASRLISMPWPGRPGPKSMWLMLAQRMILPIWTRLVRARAWAACCRSRPSRVWMPRQWTGSRSTTCAPICSGPGRTYLQRVRSSSSIIRCW